jgi:hypothetical protein
VADRAGGRGGPRDEQRSGGRARQSDGRARQSDGQQGDGRAGLAGLSAAVVALLLRAPFLVVIVVAAGTAAALHATGVA